MLEINCSYYKKAKQLPLSPAALLIIRFANQFFLLPLPHPLDLDFPSQRRPLVRALFDIHHLHRRAAVEKTCALAALVLFEAPLRVAGDAAIQRTIGSPYQIDVPAARARLRCLFWARLRALVI